MNDEVTVAHRHEDMEEQMKHVEDERIDGLRVSEYTCSCGFGAAVLSRVDQEEQGASWPYKLPTPAPLA